MRTEFEWIEKIRSLVGEKKTDVIVGIGDDAAVLEPLQGKMVVTTDALIESVHFGPYFSDSEIGHKALAVNLSDLAAMGARPKYALISLSGPSERIAGFLEPFYKGFGSLAKRFGVQIVGGNLASSAQVNVHVTLIGEVAHPLLRSTCQVGDLLGLMGAVGESAVGLRLLQKLGRESALENHPELARAHLFPQPLVEEGLSLRKLGVTSAIDISDGLAGDLGHLARSSQVSLELEHIPLSKTLLQGASALGVNPEPLALQGGEDYALAFSFAASQKKALEAAFGDRFQVIGKVTSRNPGQVWIQSQGSWIELKGGYDHFRTS